MHVDAGLRRIALRTLLGAYPGLTPPDWALALLREGLAGFTLFGRNVRDGDQVAAAARSIRAVRPDALLAIDEEGGDVTRLAHATGSPYPGSAALGAVGDLELTGQVYRAIGNELAALGVNVDFAPVVDVNSADDNPIIGTRSFGSDPDQVARHGAAAVRGLQNAGVVACAKHFPGHGAATTDSHQELPTVDVPMSVLGQRDLPPFAAAVEAGVRALMTAHIRVPALTGDEPATFSRAALHDLLRHDYGFAGAVVTDALEMTAATSAAGGVGPAAVRALRAGADLLCIGSRVDAALIEAVAADIATAVGRGELDRGRVEEAAVRVDQLATWATGAQPGRVEPAAGIGYAAARRAVRVDGVIGGLVSPLVVQLVSSPTIAEGRVPWGLAPHLADAQPLRVVPAGADPASLSAVAGERPIVVVGRHLHRLPGGRELVEALAVRHAVTVVEMGWPSTWRPAGVRAFVTTYGASHANGRAAAEVLGLARSAATGGFG